MVEVFKVDLGVEGDIIHHIVLGSGNDVLGTLHIGVHLLTHERVGQVELRRACEEAGEEVDDVVVGACIEEHLAVEAAGELQTQFVCSVPFGCHTGLGRHRVDRLRGVGHQTEARVEQPAAVVELVGAENGEHRRRLMLRYTLAVLVPELVVGVVALDAEAVLQTVLADEVGHLHIDVEAVDGAVFVVAGTVVECDAVVGIGDGAFENCRGAGDEAEVGAGAVVAPMVVGDGLVVGHRVVEVETEEAGLAAGARVDGELAVEVHEVERQAALYGNFVEAQRGGQFVVEQRRGLGEVGVLGRQQVGDGGPRFVRFLLQRSFEDEVGAKGVEAHLAGVVTLVAVAGRDVHHRRQAAAILGTEAAGVDVGVEDDVGLEDGV